MDFGYGGDTSYETCHLGLSPLAAVMFSREYRREEMNREMDHLTATHLTTSDVRASRSRPPKLPTEFWAFLHMLGGYLALSKSPPTIEMATPRK